jgi:hypothetical protein
LGIAPDGCRIAKQMSLAEKVAQSPAEGELLFELDPEPLEEAVTAYGGIPVFLQAARSLDVGCEASSAFEAAAARLG